MPVPIGTHQDVLGTSIIYMDLNVEIFIRNGTFDFKLSSHFISYLCQIVTSDKILCQFSTENLKGISKMSLLFI